MNIIYLIIFFSFVFPAFSWKKSSAQPLINKSISHLYNYQFDSTYYYLDIARKFDDKHPIIPFLSTSTDWIAIQTDIGIAESYDNLRESLDKNIPIYESLVDQYPKNAEYLLYLGSLYGLETRIEIAFSHWIRAFFSNRKGYKYINEAYQINPELKDIYLPLGLIYYYTCISSPFIQFLSKIAGINVDCNKSIEYLEIASSESYFGWIESNNVLSYIYLYIEKDYNKALKKIQPLVEEFPNHPFFAFLEAECLLNLNKNLEFEQKYSNLERFLKHRSNTVKQECFIKLNYLNALKHYYNQEYDLAIHYSNIVIDNYSMEFNWLLGLGYFLRAKSYIELNNNELAKEDLMKVSNIDFKFPEKKESQDLLYLLSNDK